MPKLQHSVFLFTAIAFNSINLYAADANLHQVIAPKCLLNKLSTAPQTVASTDKFALINVNDAGITELMHAKKSSSNNCGSFRDVSRAWQKNSKLNKQNAQTFLHSFTTTPHRAATTNYAVQYPDQVHKLLEINNPGLMWDNLAKFSSFKNRYAKADTGVESEDWIADQITSYLKDKPRADVTMTRINTPGANYKQTSLILKVGASSEPGIVIGAHMDSMPGNHKPAADDDGSGSMTVLEVARTILASDMQFKQPIYFMWYAAEEEGLVGSDAVVAEFKEQNIPVAAVLHFDMTGFAYQGSKAMWVMDDYVDTNLTNFLAKLIKTYVKRPVKHTWCGYACSDHASWSQAGYPAALAAETAFENTNPAMHGDDDTEDNLSLEHMTDYLKLGTAYVVELAQPV